jgi:hypothetical protein
MRLPVFIACLLLSSLLFGQTRSKITYGVSLNPTITFPINTSSSDKPISSSSSQTYKEYADSVKSFDTYKLSVGATVWLNYMLNQKWTLQTGVGYSEVGFTRQQKNIQLGDPLFPGVGVGQLQELSSTEKSIDYSYKYQYLTVPVLFNYYAKRSGDFKWVYYLTGGVGFNVLLKHQIKAKLNDFVMDGETVFHIDSTGYEGSPFTVNVFLGGRIEYRVNKELQVFGQPMVTAFPVSVSKTELKSFPVGLQVNVGILYSLDASKDDSRKD